uniref:RSE1/DDB1/CPSF1 first beta-propeller domain-containing protein n=1 Tax=Sinocyclocheilus grahami TaxID=75366 RepID=A0A672P6K3_SINGR
MDLFSHLVIDYVVVGSDSGCIVILEYHPSKNMFEKIHQEMFSKSGCRRIVPGQFLAVDPKGRAVMIVPGGSDGPSGVLICSENYKTSPTKTLRTSRTSVARSHKEG